MLGRTGMQKEIKFQILKLKKKLLGLASYLSLRLPAKIAEQRITFEEYSCLKTDLRFVFIALIIYDRFAVDCNDDEHDR